MHAGKRYMIYVHYTVYTYTIYVHAAMPVTCIPCYERSKDFAMLKLDYVMSMCRASIYYIIHHSIISIVLSHCTIEFPIRLYYDMVTQQKGTGTCITSYCIVYAHTLTTGIIG